VGAAEVAAGAAVVAAAAAAEAADFHEHSRIEPFGVRAGKWRYRRR
jgi:hypothetical protein